MPARALTPVVLLVGESPLAWLNSTAAVLAQYCNVEMAFKTLVLVSRDTLPLPFATRDTVAVETPANLATSFIVPDIPLSPINRLEVINPYIATKRFSNPLSLFKREYWIFNARMTPKGRTPIVVANTVNGLSECPTSSACPPM